MRARCVLLVVASFALFAGGSVAAAAAPTISTDPTPNTYVPLAGSKTALVYETVQAGLPQPVKYSCPPFGGCLPQDLIVRDADGSEKTLADLTSIDVPLIRWSLAGDTLTAVRSDDHRHVYWWNIAGTDHGELTVPAGTYVSAAPNGATYITHNGDFRLIDNAGTTSSLVTLGGGRRLWRAHGVADASGVIVSREGYDTTYVPWDDPSSTVKLANGGACWAMSAKFAACTQSGAPGGRPDHAALIARDGSKVLPLAAKFKNDERFGAVGLQGKRTLVWQTFTKNANGVLTCQAAHGSHATAGGRKVAFGIEVSAFGKVVAVSKSGHKLLMTTGACPKTAVIDSDS